MISRFHTFIGNLEHSSTTSKLPNLRVMLEEHVLHVNMVSWIWILFMLFAALKVQQQHYIFPEAMSWSLVLINTLAVNRFYWEYYIDQK